MMKEIEEALKIDNSWLHELCLERDRKLKEEIMSGGTIYFSGLAPITVEDLMR